MYWRHHCNSYKHLFNKCYVTTREYVVVISFIENIALYNFVNESLPCIKIALNVLK